MTEDTIQLLIEAVEAGLKYDTALRVRMIDGAPPPEEEDYGLLDDMYNRWRTKSHAAIEAVTKELG